jgi:hypothetical protein
MANITSPQTRISGSNAQGIGRTWTESIATRDGGTQTVRFVEDWTGLWIQAGRWAADACIEVQTTWSSVRGLSTSLEQSATTQFSADFGNTYPPECRFMGATDFNIYYETRTIDFIHVIPAGVPWKHFMANQHTYNASDTTVMQGTVTEDGGTAKTGWRCEGAYDGFGRWSNPHYRYHKISDSGCTHHTAAFSTATSNAFNWEGANDAKVTVDGLGNDYSGQDTTESAGFGNDDQIVGFFDTWPTNQANMGGGRTYSSAVWVLIKMGGGNYQATRD